MRWSGTHLVSGMQSLLSGISYFKTNSNSLEDIRQVIMDEIDYQTFGRNQSLKQMIRSATDLQTLWYMRGDVMAAIAINEGEAIAKRKMAYISNQFKGLLPKGLTTRPSPLGD